MPEFESTFEDPRNQTGGLGGWKQLAALEEASPPSVDHFNPSHIVTERLASNQAPLLCCSVYDLLRAPTTLPTVSPPAETTLVRAHAGTLLQQEQKKAQLRAAQEFQRVHISHADA